MGLWSFSLRFSQLTQIVRTESSAILATLEKKRIVLPGFPQCDACKLLSIQLRALRVSCFLLGLYVVWFLFFCLWFEAWFVLFLIYFVAGTAHNTKVSLNSLAHKLPAATELSFDRCRFLWVFCSLLGLFGLCCFSLIGLTRLRTA